MWVRSQAGWGCGEGGLGVVRPRDSKNWVRFDTHREAMLEVRLVVLLRGVLCGGSGLGVRLVAEEIYSCSC